MSKLQSLLCLKLLMWLVCGAAMAKNSSTSMPINLDHHLQKHIQQCGEHYYQQIPPEIINQKLTQDFYPLCFHGFAIGYSGVSRTALWSAEYLTRERIASASTLERINDFHEESRLPKRLQAKLSDYKNSGYDRGHLAPNGDMADSQQQYDSFSLANIVPQDPQNNRNAWRNIESRTRHLTNQYGEVYVVTGVAFQNNPISQLNQRIFIPSHLYKAVYIPSIKQAGVYYSPNDDSQRMEVISLDELTAKIGMNVMPNVPKSAQQTAMPLPIDENGKKAKPSQKSTTNEPTNDDQGQILAVIATVLVALFKWLGSLLG